MFRCKPEGDCHIRTANDDKPKSISMLHLTNLHLAASTAAEQPATDTLFGSG